MGTDKHVAVKWEKGCVDRLVVKADVVEMVVDDGDRSELRGTLGGESSGVRGRQHDVDQNRQTLDFTQQSFHRVSFTLEESDGAFFSLQETCHYGDKEGAERDLEIAVHDGAGDAENVARGAKASCEGG